LKRGLGATELSVFDTAEPTEIADTVVSFCRAHLDAAPIGARFYVASVGCVIGLVLESGRDVVMKAYQRRWRPSFLAAMQAAQRCAASGGLPCATPLLPPTPVAASRDTYAVVESWLPDPGMCAIATDAALGVSATGLARQISLCTAIEFPDLCQDRLFRPGDRRPIRTRPGLG
jgi:hypothetical protein